MGSAEQIAVGSLTATVVSATGGLALHALGVGGAGVVSGSIAAGLQGPAVVAGSWFAACQSLGATGALGAVAAKTEVASAITFLSGKAWGRAWGKRS